MPPRRGWNVGGGVNGYWDRGCVAPFPTAWMGTGSPPWYRTQTCQLLSTLSPTRSLSRNAGLLVSYTNYLTQPQTTYTASLKQHTNLSSNHDTTPVSIPVNPPHIPPSPRRHLKISLQSPVFHCWGRPLWSGWNIHFRFVSSLCLSDAHPWAGRDSR